MTEAEEISDKGHMMETGEGILHSEADSEVTMIQEGLTEDETHRDRGDNT